MEWVEKTGKTIDEALTDALNALGIEERDAEWVVIAEPKSGFLGVKKTPARVKVRVRPERQRPKETKGGRSRSSSPRGRKRGSASGASTPAEPRGTSAKESAGSGRSRSGGGSGSGAQPSKPRSGSRSQPRSSKAVSVDLEGGTADETTEPGVAAASNGAERRPGRSGGQEDRSGRAAKVSRVEDSDTGSYNEGNEIVDNAIGLEEQVEMAQEFLEGVLDEFDLDGEVKSEKIDDDTVVLNVEGESLGLLIGPKAATLGALQELTRTVVQRRAGVSQGRIMVDVGGYRARRRLALEDFTAKVVEQVKASGEESSLEPMSPSDRKVVHDTVNGIDGVHTRSEGVEPNRRVVIALDD